MPNEPKDSAPREEPSASDYQAKPDAHLDQQSGARVPTPDPKDQTGDPDEDDNPAMRELRERQSRRTTEG